MKLMKKVTEQSLLEKLTYLTGYNPDKREFPDHHLPAVYWLIQDYYLSNYFQPADDFFPPKALKFFQFSAPPIPDLPLCLYDHQVKAIHKLWQYYHHPFYKGLVLNMSMGSGKTLTAIEFLKLIQPSKVLLVAPKTILANVWYPALTKHLHDTKIKIIPSTYHSLHKKNTHQVDVLIADESHYLRNPRTLRARALMSIRSKFSIFLTGTPIINHAGDIYVYAKTIIPKNLKLPSFWGWMDEFHYIKRNNFGGFTIGKLKSARKFILQSLFNMLSYTYINQPSNTIQIIKIHLPKTLTKETNVELHKAEEIRELLRYKNAVIVVAYKKTAEFLYNYLSTFQPTQLITGDTKDRTINPNTQTLIITLGTGTEGIDLTQFQAMYILTPNWSPALLNQLTARIWRGNEDNYKKPVYLVVTNHQTDAIRLSTLDKKVETLMEIQGGV